MIFISLIIGFRMSRVILVIVIFAALAGYIVFETSSDFTRLRSLIGIFSLIAIAFVFSCELIKLSWSAKVNVKKFKQIRRKSGGVRSSAGRCFSSYSAFSVFDGTSGERFFSASEIKSLSFWSTPKPDHRLCSAIISS